MASVAYHFRQGNQIAVAGLGWRCGDLVALARLFIHYTTFLAMQAVSDSAKPTRLSNLKPYEVTRNSRCNTNALALDLAVFVKVPSVLWWRWWFRSFVLVLLGVFVVAVSSRPAGAFVWVLGSRSLPSFLVSVWSRVVAAFARSGLARGVGGRASGADLFALRALLAVLPSLPASVRGRVRSSSLVSAAWCSFAGAPAAVRPVVSQASRVGACLSRGGRLPRVVRVVLLLLLCWRVSRRLAVSGAGGLRCFCWRLGWARPSSLSTCALGGAGVRGVFAFVRVTPQLLGGGVWVRASLAGVPAWRWLPRGSKLSRAVGAVSAVRVDDRPSPFSSRPCPSRGCFSTFRNRCPFGGYFFVFHLPC